jgi:hypothetical protein
MAFTHSQGKILLASGGTISTIGTTESLASTPSPGDVIWVGVGNITGHSQSTVTVADSNGNAFTATPNSNYSVNSRPISLFYLVAPSNVSGTIITKAGAGGNFAGTIIADVFHVSGGTATFDHDAVNNSSANPMILPSITPTHANSLLYSFATAGSASFTAPAAGGTLGSWTGGGAGIQNGVYAEEYILSATGATGVDYTNSSSTSCDGIVAAFYILSAAVTNKPHVQMF